MTKPKECPHCTAPERDIEPIYGKEDKIVGWVCNCCGKTIRLEK